MVAYLRSNGVYNVSRAGRYTYPFQQLEHMAVVRHGHCYV